jgi:hypothetical protein
MRASNLIGVLGIILAIAFPTASMAGIVQTAVYPDTDIPVGGSVTFPTLTGDTAAGVILSFDGFTQPDITSISWSIDAKTYDLTALDLYARTGEFPCNPGMTCSYSFLSLSPTSETQGGGGCSLSDGLPLCTRFSFGQAIAFVPTAIPEPSTWAMMLLGFAGLGFAGWHARQKSVVI